MKLAIASFVAICILLSASVLLTDPFFTPFLLQKTSSEESISVTAELFEYFFYQGSMPPVFNEGEASHMSDVRVVMSLLATLLVISMIVFGLRVDSKNIKKVTKIGSIAVIAILLIFVFAPFESLFTGFHMLFFPQGNWQFPSDSTIISLYPGTFFFWYFSSIALHALIACVTLLLLTCRAKSSA